MNTKQGGGIDLHAAYAAARMGESLPAAPHRRKDGRLPMPMLAWTLLHRCYIRPETPFTLHDHLYLIDIYNCTAQHVRIKKSGQSGLSELLVSLALHACDERKLDVLYLMPTHGDMQDFSQMRFEPAVQASPHLSRLLSGPGKVYGRSARQADNVGTKIIGTNHLALRGASVQNTGGKAQKANRLKSVPADLVILDEYDEMKQDVLPLAIMRMGASPVKQEWLASTPSYPGVGIDAEWPKTDQREWFIPCPRCGKKQMITMDHIIIEEDSFGRPLKWHGQDEDRAYAACMRCGHELDHLAQGEWVARQFGKEIVGFHVTKLFSPQTPLIDIVKRRDTLDESMRQQAVNQDLGDVYEPRGGRIPMDMLRNCLRPYARGPLPPETSQAFMGVDVSPNGLHVIIRAPDPERPGERRLLLCEEVPSHYDVGRLIRLYNVSVCVMDAAPETTKSRELQADFRDGQIWLSYFPWTDAGSTNPDPIVWDAQKGIVNLDRTRVLDGMYGRFYDQENTLPQDAEQIRDYFNHLRAPVRVTEQDRRGNRISAYREGSNPDHFALAETYCYVASKRGTWWIA